MAIVTLSIEGMNCRGCKARVEQALATIDPAAASVTRSPDRAVVDLAPGQTAQAAIDAIVAAGYGAVLAEEAQ